MNGLHERFLRGLAAAPDGAAWRVDGYATTYREAHDTALAVADEIRAAGSPAVGVLANKNATAYLGVLATLYAGAAVVPLNPELPTARLRAIVAAAGVRTVVTDAAGTGLLPAIAPDAAVVRTDALTGLAPLTGPAHVAPDATAYVMFTSGSTGRPKGVPISHANAVAYFDLLDTRYDFTAADVFSQTFDLGFDCAMFDLFCAWGAGATVVPLAPTALRDLPAAIADEKITVWYSAPSAIGVVRRTGRLAGDAFPSLRWTFFAGEALRVTDVEDWTAAAPASAIENLYGPTELTITITAHRWSPATSPGLAANGIVAIGPVHPGHARLLLDEDGRPATRGPGELCVSGPQVTAGYLDPADDAGRFVQHAGRRYYRTGDRVDVLPDGALTYLGRVDDQVQVHGERVELAEIEHAVAQVDGIADTAAVVHDGELVVFHTGAPTSPAVLARALRDVLPAGVVPRRYHRLAALPVNANRKTDRRALALLAGDDAQAPPTPPASIAASVSSTPALPAVGDGTLHGFLDAAAERDSAAGAVRDATGAWTYGELRAISHGVARWLDRLGLHRGDRLLVQLPNVRHVVGLLYGCARRGVALVPINPDVKPYILSSVIADCTPAVAVLDGTVSDEVAAGIRAAIPAVFTLEQVWAQLPHTVYGGEPGRPDDVGTLIYTSGSTAAPKGVVCPQAQMSFAASAIASQLGYRADDVVYCRTPLSFDYGLFQVFLVAIAGAELVVASGPDLGLLREIRACGATVVPAVPSLSTMLVRLGARDRQPTRLRLVTNTGAALQQTTIDALRDTFPGLQVARMYGITECKRVSIMPPDLEFECPESVGRPLPGTTVTIVGDDGTPVPVGEIGQIVVDGPNVMAGYWQAPDITAQAYRLDPATGRTRLFTGDWGRLDADGYLYFSGRRDDTFKRKGVRMSTVEIEAAATDVPGVHAAAALAPADDHDLALWVAGDVTVEHVRAELAQRLEPAKLPALLTVLDELPVTLNGKPDKKVLAAGHTAVTDRSVLPAAA